MLLVIHNLPMNTRFNDVKLLLLEKCGLRNLILDKLVLEDNAMKITVGLPTEEDAALMVRKINGLYLKGHQLYVQDMRQKPSEQPYRVSKSSIQHDHNEQQDWDSNEQQNWNNNPQQSWQNNQQQGWQNNQEQGWNDNQQQGWNDNQQQGWNNTPQQGWNNTPQQSWNNRSQQNWNNPAQNRNNESQRKSNPFLYQQQNQNVQGGYGPDLVTAATMWAQQAQQVNAVYDNQAVNYPQNVQYPQQFSQVDNQGYGGWGHGSQNQGVGDYTNPNTSWGESPVSVQSRGRSQETRRGNNSRRGRSDRSFERDSRDHSRQYSQPREGRFERSQAGNKRRWEEGDRGDDDWRQRPASPPREFRQHHKEAPRRSGFGSGAPEQGFQSSNARFEAPKSRFQVSKPRFEGPKPKFNKTQKFNAPKPKFNTTNPRFNPSNAQFPNQFERKKIKIETLPWDQLTEKQQQKLIKRNEYNRRSTVNRITVDIFNDLGLDQDDTALKSYFTDPVRARLNKVVGDDKYYMLDIMYAKYLDVYNDDKQNILEEAKQLQKDGVEPKLQKLFIKPVIAKPPETESGVTSYAPPQAKRFKANAIVPSSQVGPSVSGKIPSYVDGDKQKFKAIKQQHLKDMETLRCPDVSPALEKIVDDEVNNIADVFHKVIEKTPDERQRLFLKERASGECIEDFKKMFKQKICQRLTNEGAKIVRIFSAIGSKPPKKAELEPFMRQFKVLALKKSDRKPFFTAHLDSYKTLDELCKMGTVKIGYSDVIFKPLHIVPKYKRVHMSSLNKMRNKYVASQIKKPEVNILKKDWEIKLVAVKEKEEMLKQEKAAEDEKLKQENAAQEAKKKDNEINAENAEVKSENNDVIVDNVKVKLENGNVKSEKESDQPVNDNFIQENDEVESENDEVMPENPNTVIHTDKYGELHSNFDIIDEVQGSDTENDPNNDTFHLTSDFNDDEGLEKSDISILRELPVGSDREIIFDDDDDESEGDDDNQAIAEDIDLDNIDEDDLEDY